MKYWITLIGSLLMACTLNAAETKPNIIFILADDMGYGDMSHAGGKAQTPACDRLANEGMRFLDAHTSSSVCTPTRYGILTGRYNWRSSLKKGVLYGFSDPLIPANKLTIAGFLRQQGYHTGIVGKWHLGIGWQRTGAKIPPNKPKKKFSSHKNIDYTKPVIGPTANGFDSFWGIAASLDMPPYVYINNDRVETLPTVTKAFHRPGPASADFQANQCLEKFAQKARSYIRQQSQDKTKPFFLYLPLTSPHTPIVPSAKWKGKSPIGKYGDFLMETDWVVGEVLAELDAQGIANNTLVIFTADNGCSPAADIADLEKKAHKPNANWRGHKADIFEGGHRVPFLVRWPGKIKANSKSYTTICTTDFFRTAADAAGAIDLVKTSVAEDSVSFLPAALGATESTRKSIIHHSINGSFSIRQGKWKLCLCADSGGWSYPRPGKDKKVIGTLPPVQLYDLDTDPTEQKNLYASHPEITLRLVELLATQIKNGRSTLGPSTHNDGSIPFSKSLLQQFPQLKQ